MDDFSGLKKKKKKVIAAEDIELPGAEDLKVSEAATAAPRAATTTTAVEDQATVPAINEDAPAPALDDLDDFSMLKVRDVDSLDISNISRLIQVTVQKKKKRTKAIARDLDEAGPTADVAADEPVPAEQPAADVITDDFSELKVTFVDLRLVSPA